jgi:transcription elongation factor Elf1
MLSLIPGQWYLMFTCKHCQERQVLFPDLSHGTTKLTCSYVVECANCKQSASYEGDTIERYQHPSSDTATS